MKCSVFSPVGSFLVAGHALLIFNACAAPLKAPDVGADVALAVGAPRSVELRIEGDALDVSAGNDERLKLVDGIRLAVVRDAGLQVALARVRIALAEAQQARLLPNPILSLVLRVPEGGGGTEIEAGLTAELAAILKRPRLTAAADRRLRAAAADAVTVALDTVANLRERYANAQAHDEALPLVRERAAVLDRLVELAQSRVELGEAARVDVTTLRARRVELELEVADLELRRRQARLALARSIGEPSGAAEWELDGWMPLDAPAASERVWIAAALRRRPEIQSAVLESAALGDDAAVDALARWDGASVGAQADRVDGWAVGPALDVPLPLLDFGDARRMRADARIVAARHELVDVSRRVVEEVRRAHAELLSSHASLARVRDELIPLQRQRREDVEAIYLAGQTDVTTLLLAEQDLQATQAKLVELEERAAVAVVRLERAVGGPAAARDVAEGRDERSNDPTPEH
ncbi:MAG: TolC family protein [Planctomycetes bacterium]|nr:TolC family protein [Planctomycetota bacterium]